MKTKKLIKTFAFTDENRRKIALATGARMPPGSHQLEIEAGADGKYPTATDCVARTWVSSPTTVKRWIGFQAEVTHGRIAGVDVTEALYRVRNSTAEYFWNGAAWVTTASSWSTEAEVADHIGSFPVADQSIGFAVCLRTSDPEQTPVLTELRVLWESDIEFQEDIILRSLIPDMRAHVRPIADVEVEPGAGTTIDLKNDFKIETPYSFTAGDSAYNLTEDPRRLENVLQSYAPSTMLVTLTEAAEDGDVVLVRLEYEPVVQIGTSQDYDEVGRVPCLLLEDVSLRNASAGGQSDWVLNKRTGGGSVVRAPIQGDLEVVVVVLTDKEVDQQRLTDALKAYAQERPLLRSVGLDEEFGLWLVDEYDRGVTSGVGWTRSARARLVVGKVLAFAAGGSADAHAVKALKVSGDVEFEVG